MKTILFKADTRGHADHGWLDTHHTFSFANYHNPARVHFGALRVVNDDIVAPGKGFGTHPHDNMEIVSIPLSGALRHGDNMGHGGVIQAGEVQVMSAGSGVTHSEFNASQTEPVNFFQIWIFPDRDDVEPRYEQRKFEFPKNDLVRIVSPESERDAGLWIHQSAWLHLGVFDRANAFEHNLHDYDNGLFAMVVEGEFEVASHRLERRDAIGISDVKSVAINPLSADARILLIEVPMSVGQAG